MEGAKAPLPMDDEAVRRHLAELQCEMGSVTAVITRSDRVEKPAYTLDDLAAKMEGEGTKPWERLEMSPAEYLRYKNSGLELFQWRERAIGRKEQLLSKPAVGFASRPYNGEYYARLAWDVVSCNLAGGPAHGRPRHRRPHRHPAVHVDGGVGPHALELAIGGPARTGRTRRRPGSVAPAHAGPGARARAARGRKAGRRAARAGREAADRRDGADEDAAELAKKIERGALLSPQSVFARA